MKQSSFVSILFGLVSAQNLPIFCPDYLDYAEQYHPPFSSGRYNLSYQRPIPACRTANSSMLESFITEMEGKIADPDLYRLFQNSFPNTLDTAIRWQGFAANNSAEELAFIITGDINAMWLRDSANQMLSYQSFLLSNETEVFAPLYRGVLNLQSRYVQTSPYCNSFQPPVESAVIGLNASVNGAAENDAVVPIYNNQSVFECNNAYFGATGDVPFFGRLQWVSAVQTILNLAQEMTDITTYGADGTVLPSPYTFQRLTDSASETLLNKGAGSPVKGGTGLIRSAFRPSDDSTLYQLFIPANMQFSYHLGEASRIMRALGQASLADAMSAKAASVMAAIETHGIIQDPKYGSIYAFEVDGYGGVNSMDDANIPSLLAAPVYGYINTTAERYLATRAKVLSNDNPYFMRGPVMNTVGGPHIGPGMAWPMANIVRILTSDNKTEITTALREIVSSTDGLGLIHESVNTFSASDWTRQWFSWANGLFGQAIIDIEGRVPGIPQQSFPQAYL